MKNKHRLALGLVIVALLVAGCGPSSVPLGTFNKTGSMATARAYHKAALLQDGRVLIVGGRAADDALLASAELYDPKTGSFAATGSMDLPRIFHTATTLLDGRVLVTGGNGGPAGRALSEAELYDPRTGKFSATGAMTTVRSGQTATLLQDGRVLVAGGVGGSEGSASNPASAEVYDPATGTFRTTGSMTTTRSGQTATLLANGQVLIAGGVGNVGSSAGTAGAELYDPITGAFSQTGSMASLRSGHAATLLPDGRVLILGGVYPTGELYDPKTGSFNAAGSIPDSSLEVSMDLLPNGRVLVITDFRGNPVLYDPKNGTFTDCGTWIGGFHPSTLLSDGRVLIAGGDKFTSDEAWVYQP